MTRRNAFYAQSGGVTAVINVSAAAVIETARKHRDRIGKVYAGRTGIIGALTEDLIDTSRELCGRSPALRYTPAGRSGLPLQAEGIGRSRARYERLLTCSARDIGYSLQRQQRLADTCQGVADGPNRLSAARRTCRKPSTTTCRSPTTAGLRLGGEIRRHVDARGGVRCRFDGEDVDEDFRARSDGRNAGWITAAVSMADDASTPIPTSAAVSGNPSMKRPS
jgi:6-phosphofructokinase 1